MHDDLGDHWIVERSDLIALLHGGIHPRMVAAQRREFENRQRPGAGQKARVRILRIQPRLYRVAVDAQLLLLQRQLLPARHAQLPFHQILAGDLFRHRVLDLQARVHFHEPDAVGAQAFAGVGDELDGAGVDVIHRARGFHGGGAERSARGLVHARRGGFFDHFLVAALQRAIALEQMYNIAVAIAKHLHLDMARALHSTFPAARDRRRKLPPLRAWRIEVRP